MRFFLDEYELNNPAKRVYVDEDVEGFDLPAIRSSRGNRAGQSGSYFGAQFWDSRRITIKGRIFSSNINEALQKRREIQAVLPLYPQRITLRVIDDDGYSYILYCQAMDFKMPIGRFRGKSLFKLELEAPDSTIFDDTAGAALTAVINKAVPGGVLFSPTSPMFGTTTYFTTGAPNSSINNASPIEVFPVLVIVGKTTNPIIANRTTGEVFRMEDYSVGADSVTQIDMFAHTVRLGSVDELVNGLLPDGAGGNAFPYVPLTSSWWGLAPDINEISFDSGAGSDVSEAVMIWRPGLRGI